MFNFPPKVCGLLCAGKAEWNLENLNFFLLLLISVKRPKGAVLMMRSYAIEVLNTVSSNCISC